jgi:hypothetical protein
MSIDVPVDEAARDLKGCLERLPCGHAMRLVDPDGQPVALVTSLREEPDSGFSYDEWEERWLALAQRIDKAWKSDKTALETLADMRR